MTDHLTLIKVSARVFQYSKAMLIGHSFRIPLLLVILSVQVLLAPGSVCAAPAVACHCFQERQFSAEKPQAFDPYLLATGQNRLLAQTFAR